MECAQTPRARVDCLSRAWLSQCVWVTRETFREQALVFVDLAWCRVRVRCENRLPDFGLQWFHRRLQEFSTFEVNRKLMAD
jgi:hypothetical protein